MKKKNGPLHRSKDDTLVNLAAYTLCTLVLLVTLYPLIYVVSSSFSDPIEVARGSVVLWPVLPTLEGYETVLKYEPIWIGYRNTIFYTVAGTLINLAVTLPCAYALSRRELPGRKLVTLLFTFTMFFSGGLIPRYLVMKQMNLINTVGAMLLPVAMSVYNMIIARTYFSSSIPEELQEAARIDGCSTTGTFIKVVLPLSMPIIAVISLYYAVSHWNSYFNALIYLSKQQLYPLQLFLRNILIENLMADMANADSDALEAIIRQQQLKESMKYSIVVVSSLPIIMVYPFIQRFFVKGVMIGAIKG